MAGILWPKVAISWMSALPRFHVAFDLLAVTCGHRQTQLLATLLMQLSVATAQLHGSICFANMLEVRKNKRVTRQLLSIGFTPRAGESRGIAINVPTKGCAISLAEIGKSNRHRNTGNWLLGIRRAMQIPFGYATTVEEPVKRIQNRGLPYAPATDKCRQALKRNINISNAAIALDAGGRDPHF
jgi:hypothetical protein